MLFFGVVIFFACVFVSRLHDAHFFEVLDSMVILIQGQMCGTLSVVGFHICLITFYRVFGIKESQSKVFGFNTYQCSVAIVNSLFLWRHITKNSLWICIECFIKLIFLEILIPLSFKLFSFLDFFRIKIIIRGNCRPNESRRRRLLFRFGFLFCLSRFCSTRSFIISRYSRLRSKHFL